MSGEWVTDMHLGDVNPDCCARQERARGSNTLGAFHAGNPVVEPPGDDLPTIVGLDELEERRP